MAARTIKQLIKAQAVSEGAGVTVHRTIGTAALKHLDPFLMLDYFNSDNPDDYIAGFPDHPHRGFITFTYMLDGDMLHRDSMGNQGHLHSGGAQWMKAASGVIHSEMPKQVAGLMRGFQLWINLPASEKMTAPAYQEFSDAAIPRISSAGQQVKILSGEYQGVRGPIIDATTQVIYLDVSLQAAQTFSHDLEAGLQGFIYVFEAELNVAGTRLAEHSFAVLNDGDTLQAVSGDKPARFIIVAGKPLREPIVQYGPFVMNTTEEIKQAISDYNNGVLVQNKAAVNSY
ncbi:MAG: pirin family protein [Gammaproteobacteria bacterium]|nr:pirin family protein [Gammaproteobacteria bacterium]